MSDPVVVPTRRKGGHPVLNCFSTFAIAISALSPFILWNTPSWYVGSGTGPFLASRVVLPTSSPYRFAAIDLSYSDLDDSVCSTSDYTQPFTNETTNNFELFGDYGFCTGPNGEYTLPTEITLIRTFGALAFVFALFSSLFSCGVCAKKDRASVALVAAFCTIFAAISATVSFSTMASYNYYSDLRDGNANLVVLVKDTSSSDASFQGIPTASMGFGPVFFTYILVFLMLTFSSISAIKTVLAIRNKPSEEDDLIKANQQGVRVSSEIAMTQV